MILVSSNMPSYLVLFFFFKNYVLFSAASQAWHNISPTEIPIHFKANCQDDLCKGSKFQFIYLFIFIIFCRLSPSAAGSSPLHPSPAPGVCGHVAGGAEGERAGLRDGGGVCQHRVRNRAWAPERRSEGAAPPGTQSAGRSEERSVRRPTVL